MDKRVFYLKLARELSSLQMALINPVLFCNYDYSDYYIAFKNGEYSKCYGFIIKNKHLLDLDNCPDDRINMVMQDMSAWSLIKYKHEKIDDFHK